MSAEPSKSPWRQNPMGPVQWGKGARAWAQARYDNVPEDDEERGLVDQAASGETFSGVKVA